MPRQAAPIISRYAIVIERTQGGFSAHVPDLPACWAEGQTIGLVQHTIRLVMGAYFAKLRAQGEAIPAPSSQVGYVEIAEPRPPAPSSAHAAGTP